MGRTSLKRTAALRVSGAVIAVVIGIACSQQEAGPGSMALTDLPPKIEHMTHELPECPRDYDSIPKPQSGYEALPSGISVSGPITGIPEFHDCQRLITASGTKYGPLVAIFAAYYLDRLEANLDSLNRATARSPGANAPDRKM